MALLQPRTNTQIDDLNFIITFNKEDLFYYKVTFDQSSYEYKVFDDTTGQRVGVGPLATEAIIWYEYVNP
jgi:hypothetical protein